MTTISKTFKLPPELHEAIKKELKRREKFGQASYHGTVLFELKKIFKVK